MPCSVHVGLLAILAAGAVRAAAVNPVDKVLFLMAKLQRELEEEGAADAKEYDKFACWCKEEADARQYSLERTRAKQKALTSKIDKLATQIQKLDNRNQELSDQIDDLKTFIADKDSERRDNHADYLADKHDFETCIEHTKAAKKAMKVDAKAPDHLKLIQLAKKYAPSLLQLKVHKPEGYVQGGLDEIGDLIDGITDSCKKDHSKNEDDEFAEKSEYDTQRQAKVFESKTSTEELHENQERAEALSREKSEAENERHEEEESEAADNEFLNEPDAGLVAQCESKARAFDKRSSDRNTELTNLAKAKELIEGGAKPNWGANKKLSLLQVSAGSASALEAARKSLMKDAKRLKSSALASVAMQSKFGNFRKVRSLINDLIEKLEDEQDADDRKSGKCAGDFAREAENRDNAQLAIEEHTATISRATGDISSLKANINDLTASINQLNTALSESTEMTTSTRENLKKQEAESEEGAEAVESAIEVLGGDGGYSGNAQGDAIVGMLQVICDDFKRTLRTTRDNLSDLNSEFKSFSEETERAIQEKTDLKEQAENDLASKNTEKEDASEDKGDEQKLLDKANEAIKSLKPMCTGGESHEDRVRERKEEIQSLKDAFKILDNWKQ